MTLVAAVGEIPSEAVVATTAVTADLRAAVPLAIRTSGIELAPPRRFGPEIEGKIVCGKEEESRCF